MNRVRKLQFRLPTALALVALVAFYLGAQRSWFLRSWLHHYLLLLFLLASISFTVYHDNRRRAFWLGFTVVFGIHALRELLWINLGEGYGLITTERWGELFYRPVMQRFPALDPPEPWGESLFWVTWVLFLVAASSLAGLISLLIYIRIREES